MTKQALKASAEGAIVLVDNATAQGNVTRFAQNNGYQVRTEEAAGVYTLTISKA